MKNIGTLLSAFALILFGCCQEPDTNFKTKQQNTVLNEDIGEQIPLAVAERWISSYNKRTDIQAGRTKEVQYKLSSANLNTILSSFPQLGLAFHHAIDEYGKYHILVIAIDKSQKRLWSDQNDRICIDANSNSLVTEDTANSWAQNYKKKNPDGIWYHFFGRHVFNEIKTIPWFKEINIRHAINDSDVPQLLLVISDNSASARIKDEESIIVYDRGGTCPPCQSN